MSGSNALTAPNDGQPFRTAPYVRKRMLRKAAYFTRPPRKSHIHKGSGSNNNLTGRAPTIRPRVVARGNNGNYSSVSNGLASYNPTLLSSTGTRVKLLVLFER